MRGSIKKGCGFLLASVLLLSIGAAIAWYVNRPKWSDDYGQRFIDVAYGSREHNKFHSSFFIDFVEPLTYSQKSKPPRRGNVGLIFMSSVFRGFFILHSAGIAHTLHKRFYRPAIHLCLWRERLVGEAKPLPVASSKI